MTSPALEKQLECAELHGGILGGRCKDQEDADGGVARGGQAAMSVMSDASYLSFDAPRAELPTNLIARCRLTFALPPEEFV